MKDFVREVRKEAAKRDYVGDVQIIDQGLYAVKMWLIITPDMKVQLYHNEGTGTTNFALPLHEERIYGRNKRGDRGIDTPLSDRGNRTLAQRELSP